MMDGMGFGMGIFGLMTMLIFWGGLLALAIWLIGLLFPVTHQHNHEDTPNSREK